MGAKIKNNPRMQNLYQTWANMNMNYSVVAQMFYNYAYKPFGNDSDSKLIDPRSYYWLRPYLQNKIAKAKASGTQPYAAIPVTWATSHSSDASRRNAGYYQIPYHVNNVEATVCGDTLYGLTAMVLSKAQGYDTFFTPNVQQMYLNAAEIVAFTLNSNLFVDRVDLTMFYYPYPVWLNVYASRALFLLSQTSNLPYPVMAQAQALIKDTLRNAGQNYLTKTAVVSSTDAYWNGFVGMADDTPHQEDALWTTALSLNAIMDTWSIGSRRSGTQCHHAWDPATPPDVIKLATKAANWLNREILAGNFGAGNCATTQDAKTPNLIPAAFPGNVAYFLGNGSSIDPVRASHQAIFAPDLRVGVSGIIDETQYQSMLNQVHFGIPFSATAFKGLNAAPFVCWSIPSLTYSHALFALAKFVSASTCS